MHGYGEGVIAQIVVMADWYAFDDGQSLGTRGSESGIILKDEEHVHGARITLERGGDIAPFSITLGIYGALVHTKFYSSQEMAEADLIELKSRMESALSCWDEHDHTAFNEAVDRLVHQGQ